MLMPSFFVLCICLSPYIVLYLFLHFYFIFVCFFLFFLCVYPEAPGKQVLVDELFNLLIRRGMPILSTGTGVVRRTRREEQEREEQKEEDEEAGRAFLAFISRQMRESQREGEDEGAER